MIPETTPPKKPSIRLIVIGLIILISSLSVGGYYLGASSLTQNNPVTKISPAPITQSTPTVTVTPSVITSLISATLLYTEEKESIHSGTRSYPVVDIYRKVGDAKPELLATVGKVEEYPKGFILSPDKKTLLINLESKLQALDMSTKTLTTIFTPKKQVYSDVVYSPDGNRLFIWDQLYAPTNNDTNYFVHDFNLNTKKDTIVTQGAEEQIYYPLVWRSDNIVILGVAKGDFSSVASFNISTRKITDTPGDIATGPISRSGMRMAVMDKSIGDICNDFSASADSTQKIIDPVSAKTYTTIGSSQKIVTVLGFSPDEKKVAYSEQSPWKNKDDCSKEIPSTYYEASTENTDTPKMVTNIDALLNSWGLGERADESTNDGKSWTITEQGKTTISSNKELRVIATY
jgi:hypothetical protein